MAREDYQLGWRVIGATVRGASHARSGLPNQDAILWRPETGAGPLLIVAVSDGHGSAKYFRSHEGSRLAVETATSVLQDFLDGQPTDDFEKGLKALMDEPWGKKAVRVAIAIGADADHDVLQRFIAHPELKPLQANNPEALVNHIKWASTAVLKTASSPASQTTATSPDVNVPLPPPPPPPPPPAPAAGGAPTTAADVW